MTDERARRIGRNEALYRQVNERIEDVNAAFNTLTNVFEIVCECGNLTCMDPLTVSPELYERTRENSTHFLVKRGHEEPDVETVVAEHGDVVIVQKHPGIAEEIAAATDPREPPPTDA